MIISGSTAKTHWTNNSSEKVAMRDKIIIENNYNIMLWNINGYTQSSMLHVVNFSQTNCEFDVASVLPILLQTQRLTKLAGWELILNWVTWINITGRPDVVYIHVWNTLTF